MFYMIQITMNVTPRRAVRMEERVATHWAAMNAIVHLGGKENIVMKVGFVIISIRIIISTISPTNISFELPECRILILRHLYL